VLFRLYGIVEGARPNDVEVADRHLDAAGRTFFRVHLAGHGDRGLNGERGETFPNVGWDLRFHEDTLNLSGTISHHDERDFAGRAEMRHPTADSDRAADVLFQLVYAGSTQCR